MIQNTLTITERRARRLVSHIVWLQRHMPASSSLQQRLRQLELLVGSDSNAVRIGSETVATVTNKKEQLESCSFLSSLSVKILERERHAHLHIASVVLFVQKRSA